MSPLQKKITFVTVKIISCND